MDGPFRIRRATSADLDAVLAIERAAFSDPWPDDAMVGHLEDLFLIAEGPDGVAGFLIARLLGRDAEILNVAVADAERRRGVGRLLVEGALRALRLTPVQAVFLEVRDSNAAARSLYERLGFTPIGRRRGYYRGPREDALVLVRQDLHA